MLSRLDTERGEGPPPCSDRRDLCDGRLLETPDSSLFLYPVLLDQLRWTGTVGNAGGVDHADADRRGPVVLLGVPLFGTHKPRSEAASHIGRSDDADAGITPDVASAAVNGSASFGGGDALTFM